jgi:hypothetical protein
MKRTLILLACLMLYGSTFAHGKGDGFSLDLLAGQAFPDGAERTDSSYAVGIDYAVSGCVTIVGRAIHTMIDGDTFTASGTVGLERHLHWGARFDPYFGAGVGAVELHAPDVERTIEIDCGHEDGRCYEPTTKTVTLDADDSWMVYYGGIGFDWRLGSVFGLTADMRYLRPFDDDGPEDRIEALVGVRLDL